MNSDLPITDVTRAPAHDDNIVWTGVISLFLVPDIGFHSSSKERRDGHRGHHVFL